MVGFKVWTSHPDKKYFRCSATAWFNRKLFKIEITRKKQDASENRRVYKKIRTQIQLIGTQRYLISHDVIATNMYSQEEESIDILYNDGSIRYFAGLGYVRRSVLSKK